MVVVTVRATKSLHTTTNCYLVSLALADLITLLTSVPQVRQTTPQPSLLPGVEGSEWCAHVHQIQFGGCQCVGL